MAAEDKTILIKVEVQEAQAKVNIKKLESSIKSLDGRTKEYSLAVKKLAQEEMNLQSIQAKKIKLQDQLSVSTNKLSSSVTGVSAASGGATAATLELGRAISDAPYGIRGVANNISQFASQIAFMGRTMDAATGKAIGLGGAMKALWGSIMGPLGILLAIQAAIAALDHFAGGTEKAKEGLDSFEGESITSTVAKLMILKKALNDSNVSLEDKTSLLKAASTEFKEFENSSINTAEGLGDVNTKLTEMIGKMKEVAFAKAVLEASNDLMKDLATQLVKGAEGFGESFTGSIAQITDLLGTTKGAVQTKFLSDLGETGDGINKLYDILSQKTKDGGIFAELLFGKDDKGGSKKDPAKRINKIFKDSIFSLQQEINKFVTENEKLLTRNVFELLAIDQKAERDSIELKRTSYLEKESIRHQNFVEQEAARRKMTKAEFLQTKEGLDALATVEKIYLKAGEERDRAIDALDILQIQETNELKRKILEKHLDAMNNLRGKSNQMALKANQEINGTEAGSVGSPVSKTGAEGFDSLEEAYRAAGVIDDALFEEAMAVKFQQLRDSGLGIEEANAQIAELKYQNDLERVQREIDLEQMKIDAKKNINQEYISWVSGLGDVFKSLAGQNEALSTAALVLEKGAAISGIIVQTQAANAKISAAAVTEQSGYLSAAAQTAASVGGGIQGAAAAAPWYAKATASAVGAKARILKNNVGSGISIAKILATTLASRSSGGGGSGGGGGSASQDRTFDFNLVGNTGVNQLAQGIAGQFSGPIQAYVVSTQVTSQQQLDATIQSNASIG